MRQSRTAVAVGGGPPGAGPICAVFCSARQGTTRRLRPPIVASGFTSGRRRERLLTPADGTLRDVSVLFATHPRYFDHNAGHGHPERPARLEAVLMGAKEGGVADALVVCEPRAATRVEMERVHPAPYLDALERFCVGGGGAIDEDTRVSADSWDAASLAAGAGLAAIEALDEGGVDAAFCAVRPPGHHALASRADGLLPAQQRRHHRGRPGRAG